MSRPKHDCHSFEHETDPDHCVVFCRKDTDWLEAENARLKEQAGKAKAEVLETAKKEFVTSCSKQEDMMVLVRRWENKIEDLRREGKS